MSKSTTSTRLLKTLGGAMRLLLASRTTPGDPPDAAEPNPTAPALHLDLWKKAVETQMHFNEMSVKSRQLGLSFVVAALGVAVVLLSKPEEFQILVSSIGYQIHPSGLIILSAALGTYAVKRLDLGVYHRMLRGAVAFGEDLEKELIRRRVLPTQEGMTQSISRFSRETEPGKPGTTAGAKIGRFYTLLISTLLVIGFLMLFSTVKPIAETVPTETPPAQESSAPGDL